MPTSFAGMASASRQRNPAIRRRDLLNTAVALYSIRSESSPASSGISDTSLTSFLFLLQPT